MALNLIVPILLAATVGFITYLLTRRRVQRNAAGPELAEAKSALSTAKADFAARQEELRNFINDARERENEAKAEATKSDERYTDVAEKLKIALQEKGQFQNEATRVEEIKAMLRGRDTEIQSLNARVTDLEREKTEALKDAEAAKTRATDMVAKERE